MIPTRLIQLVYDVDAISYLTLAPECGSVSSLDLTQLLLRAFRGFAKKTIQNIRDYYGSGWVGSGLTRNFFLTIVPK